MFTTRTRDYGVVLTAESQEWNSIAHHLRVAAERYDADAATMAENNIAGLARTFRDQAAQARKFAEEIEERATD
jgi:hypothetical protein